MSKVLFLVNSDVVIYNFRFEFVERLIENGHSVVISSPNGPRIERLVEIGATHRSITIDRHGTNPITDIKLISKYKKLIKEEKPDIIFSYTIKPNIYGAIAAKKNKTPFIATITGLGTALEKKGIKQMICIHMYKMAFKSIKRVYFQNADNRLFFLNHKIALGKYELVPGSGVNLSKFKPLPYPDSDIIRFVFVGRIMEEKGIELFLKSAKTIKQKYANVEFHVCGFVEDNYCGDLQKCVDDGTVVYHGMVYDIREIYKQMHCMVFPSYYPEGISNALLEAAACARPIITTNRSGCVETVDDGLSGYIISIKNQSQLDDALLKFISLPHDKKIEMGMNGRIKMQSTFDRMRVVDKYFSELENLRHA